MTEALTENCFTGIATWLLGTGKKEAAGGRDVRPTDLNIDRDRELRLLNV